MEEKHTIAIDATLYNNIAEYCRENGLKIGAFCSSILKKGLASEKWGDIPFGVIMDDDAHKITNGGSAKASEIPIEILMHAQKHALKDEEAPSSEEKTSEIIEVPKTEPQKSEEDKPTEVVEEPKIEKQEPEVGIKPKKRRLS